MYLIKYKELPLLKKKPIKTEPQQVRNCQEKDLNLALNSLHPHQGSSLNTIFGIIWKESSWIFRLNVKISTLEARKKKSSKKKRVWPRAGLKNPTLLHWEIVCLMWDHKRQRTWNRQGLVLQRRAVIDSWNWFLHMDLWN